jgi:hypothetical protein
MYRISFLLLLLPLLTGCAARHAAPNVATAPIPALSYASALDGGNVTPIQSPIIVKHVPYPTASFERLMRASGTHTGETRTFMSRMTGTTFAVSSGDLVDITFAVEDATSSPKTQADETGDLLPKGTKITLLVEPYGFVKDVRVSLPPSSGSRTISGEIEKKVRGEFAAGGTLPKDGFHQGENFSIDTFLPATSNEKDGTLKGTAIVRGLGTYRGRPVIVCEVTGVTVFDDQPLGIHSYKFLDLATGLWSHTETVIDGSFSSGGTTGRLSAHFIDDIRF